MENAVLPPQVTPDEAVEAAVNEVYEDVSAVQPDTLYVAPEVVETAPATEPIPAGSPLARIGKAVRRAYNTVALAPATIPTALAERGYKRTARLVVPLGSVAVGVIAAKAFGGAADINHLFAHGSTNLADLTSTPGSSHAHEVTLTDFVQPASAGHGLDHASLHSTTASAAADAPRLETASRLVENQSAKTPVHDATVTRVNLGHAPREYMSTPDQDNLRIVAGDNGADHITFSTSHYNGHHALYALVTGKNGQEVEIPLTRKAGPDGTFIYSATVGKSHLATMLNGHEYDKVEVIQGNSSAKEVIDRSTAFGSDTGHVSVPANNGGSGTTGNAPVGASPRNITGPGGTPASGMPTGTHLGKGTINIFDVHSEHGRTEFDVSANGGTAVFELPAGISIPKADMNAIGLHQLYMAKAGDKTAFGIPASDFNSLHTGHNVLSAANIRELDDRMKQQHWYIRHDGHLYEIEKDKAASPKGGAKGGSNKATHERGRFGTQDSDVTENQGEVESQGFTFVAAQPGSEMKDGLIATGIGLTGIISAFPAIRGIKHYRDTHARAPKKTKAMHKPPHFYPDGTTHPGTDGHGGH